MSPGTTARPDRSAGAAVADPDVVALGFVDALRDAGHAVSLRSALLYVDALAALDGAPSPALYWAGRATLVHAPAAIGVYDRTFARYWGAGLDSVGEARGEPVAVDDVFAHDVAAAREPGAVRAADAAVAPAHGLADPAPAEDGLEDGLEDGGRFPAAASWSPAEVLRHKDFAAHSADELAETQRLLGQLRLAGAVRRSRRRRAARHGRGRPDLRRSTRDAMRTGGEIMRPRTTVTARRPRRVVLLCDVSGSMEPYTRALLRFAHVAVAGVSRVEAFALGTRLTRLTRELSTHDPDAALDRAAAAVEDWSGGTRLGAGIRAFNDLWGARGLARGAVVVICSDGWDRGDPGELAREMARLGRLAHRVVWVNPLKASPGFEPLARGMAAALPHVDAFVEGHSLASLERLAEVIAS